MTTKSVAGAGPLKLLTPQSVAVIGASVDPARIGGRAIAYMAERGFKGAVYPVNPNRAEIQGFKAYASVGDLPGTPDVAIIAVPAASVPAAVADLATRGVGTAIIFSAGFAEVGADGALLQAKMLEAARAHGMRILGPNTLGVVDVRSGFYGTFASTFLSGFPKLGRIGIASQSGAYSGHLIAAMRERGMGLASCVMTGNETDITVSDAIAAMVLDDGIDVIAVYSEGIKDGPAFIRALEAARVAKKPVIVMKVGRSRVGEEAVRSHTASIAGSDAVISTILAEHGAVRARTTEEMLDIAHLATRRVYPAKNTLGVLTVSGGGGVLIADAAEDVGLAMPPMPMDAQGRLKALMPIASPVNPIDCTAQVLNQLDLFGTFAESMARDGDYRSMLTFLTYTAYAPAFSAKLRAELGKVRERYPDRLHAVSIIASDETVAAFEADGLAVYEDPSRAVVAIAAMGQFGEAFAVKPKLAPPVVPRVDLPDATPSEAVAKTILSSIGIATSPERLIGSAEATAEVAVAMGFPVVMKIVSPDIMHKSEIGGVVLDVGSAEQARATYATLIERAKAHVPDARIEGVLVARQLRGGVECIVGMKRDPIFGPVAVFGLGGVFVEVMNDVVMRQCPFGVDVALEMINSIKGAPLLKGARGKPKADILALAEILSRLSVFAVQAREELMSIDLNPVIVMPEGQGAFVVDAVLDLAQG
ncbi:MAG: acetate--CoA ligase family protein [Hyphomicrobiaceae bacterium]